MSPVWLGTVIAAQLLAALSGYRWLMAVALVYGLALLGWWFA